MLAELQSLLVRAMLQPDPGAWLRTQLDDAATTWTDDERKWLLAVSDDGLRLTRVLVRKLRLQRLLRGDARLAALCERDPAEFARRFVAYEQEQPPRAVFPADEAAQFRGALRDA